ncbi:MAG: BrnT family toxin [Alphaproteobacteria bacterium]|nr:MAG: BrnT family toxin [Alphaproteobacteria bacterium]
MEFEWDEAKNQANRRKHGFDFAYAIRMFDGPVRRLASRRTGEERRMVATGQVEGRVVSIVYTRRNGRYRIISARPARRNERF